MQGCLVLVKKNGKSGGPHPWLGPVHGWHGCYRGRILKGGKPSLRKQKTGRKSVESQKGDLQENVSSGIKDRGQLIDGFEAFGFPLDFYSKL